jgi:hypothetical protein
MPDSSPDDGAQNAPTEDTTLTNTADGSQAETLPTQDSNGQESSSAKPAGTMLDAVTAALKPKEASPPSQEPGSEAQADPDAKPAEGESEELSADELKALSWKTQQRFKTLGSKLKAKDGEIAELKPKAEEYDKIVGSITKAGLDNREVDELVEIGGLMKRNPQAALAKILPVVEALQNVIGEILSPELQERVRLGYLTEADARALQRSHATAQLATKRADDVEAQRQADAERDAQQKLVTSSIEAVERWDKQQADKDPDWHLKRKEVAELVELAINREAQKRRAPYFPTADEAVKLSADALKTVTERMKRFAPKPNEIRTVTPGASPRSKPQPKTILEAVNAAMG